MSELFKILKTHGAGITGYFKVFILKAKHILLLYGYVNYLFIVLEYKKNHIFIPT